jgi:hypothetical protein
MPDLDFPNAPTIGQTFGRWTYTALGWQVLTGVDAVAEASLVAPVAAALSVETSTRTAQVAALQEADAVHAAHIDDPTAAHAATAISYAGSSGLSASTVEAALDELDTAVSDEATIRAAADTALDTRLDTIEAVTPTLADWSSELRPFVKTTLAAAQADTSLDAKPTIDAMLTAGRPVKLGRGWIRHVGSIELISGASISGAVHSESGIWATGTTTAVVRNRTGSSAVIRATMRDVQISSNGGVSIYGIYALGFNQCSLSNVYLYGSNLSDKLRVEGSASGGAYYNKFETIVLDAGNASSSVGIHCRGFYANQNTFINCVANGSSVGIKMSSDDGTSGGNVFVGGSVEGSTTAYAFSGPTINNQIINVRAEACTGLLDLTGWSPGVTANTRQSRIVNHSAPVAATITDPDGRLALLKDLDGAGTHAAYTPGGARKTVTSAHSGSSGSMDLLTVNLSASDAAALVDVTVLMSYAAGTRTGRYRAMTRVARSGSGSPSALDGAVTMTAEATIGTVPPTPVLTWTISGNVCTLAVSTSAFYGHLADVRAAIYGASISWA